MTTKKTTAHKAGQRRSRAAQPKREKSGRPSKYRQELDAIAHKMCLMGATDADLAEAFDVCEDTINEWKKVHPTFAKELENGKTFADAEIAAALFHRAKGYSHPALHFASFEGDIYSEEYTEHYPPDTAACRFWLMNRQRSKWREKIDVEHGGKDGAPLTSAEYKIDANTNPEEAARKYKAFLEHCR
ncbi:MAG: hypothetical protein HY749_16280 [Gammaproteobacteria bacterium]|nr:hypothetical protein [Gammaproteobacteria bacterium]